jgi:hypothetical protein
VAKQFLGGLHVDSKRTEQSCERMSERVKAHTLGNSNPPESWPNLALQNAVRRNGLFAVLPDRREDKIIL